MQWYYRCRITASISGGPASTRMARLVSPRLVGPSSSSSRSPGPSCQAGFMLGILSASAGAWEKKPGGGGAIGGARHRVFSVFLRVCFSCSFEIAGECAGVWRRKRVQSICSPSLLRAALVFVITGLGCEFKSFVAACLLLVIHYCARVQ